MSTDFPAQWTCVTRIACHRVDCKPTLSRAVVNFPPKCVFTYETFVETAISKVFRKRLAFSLIRKRRGSRRVDIQLTKSDDCLFFPVTSVSCVLVRACQCLCWIVAFRIKFPVNRRIRQVIFVFPSKTNLLNSFASEPGIDLLLIIHQFPRGLRFI